MSIIKILNNRNAIQKICVPRLSTANLTINIRRQYDTLFGNPKLQYPKYLQTTDNTTSDVLDKSWDEFYLAEYSTLKKCLKQVLGINEPQKEDEISLNQSCRKLHQETTSGGKQPPKPTPLPSSQPPTNKPLPRVLYIQNPVVWLTNKLDFRYLKKWDPNFSEIEFTRGARQAVSTITELLSKSMFDNLKPLLTKSALLSLRKDVELLWADEVRRNIALTPGDVQLIIPRKLHFRNVVDKKYCDIDMVFIGLKWLEPQDLNPNPPLVFIDIIVRFHRNYSEGMLPDWTISAFKVRRFNIVPQKN